MPSSKRLFHYLPRLKPQRSWKLKESQTLDSSKGRINLFSTTQVNLLAVSKEEDWIPPVFCNHSLNWARYFCYILDPRTSSLYPHKVLEAKEKTHPCPSLKVGLIYATTVIEMKKRRFETKKMMGFRSLEEYKRTVKLGSGLKRRR
ncbi:hypothetical protein HAX54_000070 [Datura stramonium]|uniref:Uncharacterized protein n=1 Tax=Datura stramonium TaxID=4076 RepID=A0ABS8RFU9_DATST|nr:hypothetical protein [Datura stramonium]